MGLVALVMAHSLVDLSSGIVPPTNQAAVLPSPDNNNSAGDGVSVRYATFQDIQSAAVYTPQMQQNPRPFGL